MSTLTSERKNELLKIARHSHIRWVNEGNEKDIENSIRNQEKSLQTNDHIQKLKLNIPIADTIEDILVLFSEVIDDGNDIDFESILMFSELEEDSHIHEDFSLIDDTQRIQEWANNFENTYINFIRKLRHPSVKEIITSMRQYVSKFEYRFRDVGLISKGGLASPPSSPRQDGEMNTIGREIWNYLENLFIQLHENILWKNQSEIEFSKSRLYCEKFLHQKLYPSIQSFITADDRASDQKLHKRIESLSFLLPEHLDLHMFARVDYKMYLARPMSDLQRLMDAKSPVDKLELLKCCTQSITAELNTLAGSQSSGRGSTAGVDTFLPFMILVIKELNPPMIQCTINYIQDYAHPSHLTSEFGYLLTYFISAVQFLETVDETALTISPHEFEKSIRRCKEAAGVANKKSQYNSSVTTTNSLHHVSSNYISTDSTRNRSALSAYDGNNSIHSNGSIQTKKALSSEQAQYMINRKSEILGIIQKMNNTTNHSHNGKLSEWNGNSSISNSMNTLKLSDNEYDDLYNQLLQLEEREYKQSDQFAAIKADTSIHAIWKR